MAYLRIAACQLNTIVGDLSGNVARIENALAIAEEAGADVAIFPELAITGYPPEDLLLKPGFVSDNMDALQRVASVTGPCAAIVGYVESGDNLYNAAAVCAHGSVRGVYRKQLLPNYSVFDEQRYFRPGSPAQKLFGIGGRPIGVSICEDAWTSSGPVVEEALGGAELVVNLNASPFYAGRLEERVKMLAERAVEAGCPIIYVNQVGGQDELVFDGGSLVFDARGSLVARGPQFLEEIMVFDLEIPKRLTKASLEVIEVSSGRRHEDQVHTERAQLGEDSVESVLCPRIFATLSTEEEVYEALVLGTRDYVRKNNFADAVIGLSGGIDSSLVAVIATDALGPDHVHGVTMPSRFSSESSVIDAAALAKNLGIDFRTIPIEQAHAAFLDMLDLDGATPGLTVENLQSRIRGVLLMALSNAGGWIVLTTGNKSELATGYSTLYGDTAGGFAVIKDVPKTMVYKLVEMRNARAGFDLVPQSVLTKPPSAELRPDQRDDQSLPPYDVLDPVLSAYVEQDMTRADLEEAGFPSDVVAQVVRLVDAAEYKRRQSPPGVRVSAKAFGKDRRMPITNRYAGRQEQP